MDSNLISIENYSEMLYYYVMFSTYSNLRVMSEDVSMNSLLTYRHIAADWMTYRVVEDVCKLEYLTLLNDVFDCSKDVIEEDFYIDHCPFSAYVEVHSMINQEFPTHFQINAAHHYRFVLMFLEQYTNISNHWADNDDYFHRQIEINHRLNYVIDDFVW